MRLPQSVHGSLVQMLIDDDKASVPKSTSGFSLTG
jgi:hypothetical protein